MSIAGNMEYASPPTMAPPQCNDCMMLGGKVLSCCIAQRKSVGFGPETSQVRFLVWHIFFILFYVRGKILVRGTDLRIRFVAAGGIH